MHSLYSLLEQALLSRDPEQKCRLVRELADRSAQRPPLEKNAAPPLDFREAGRPDKPNLVPPSAVTPRKMNTPEGYAAMLHAICHIEFNAINLALDAAYRFRLMPDEFVYDWIKVACEEEYHFRLMSGRLKAFGYAYGDFDAHNHL